MPSLAVYPETCLFDGCERKDGKRSRRGYCSKHYQRLMAHGNPSIVYSNKRAEIQCQVAECQEQVRTSGYCNKHYARFLRYGDPQVVHKPGLPRRQAGCTIEGCDRKAQSKNLCLRHYNKMRRNRDPKAAYLYVRGRELRKKSLQPVRYSKAQLEQRLSMFGNRCWMCGVDADTVDHVKPLKLNGLDCLSNLRPACRSCNSSKKASWFGVKKLKLFVNI